MRPKRLLTAMFAALLLLCGIPGAALAESDVVLSNESEGTDVNTGDSSFTNNENLSSGSTSFSSGDSDPITATQTAGDTTTGVPSTGQVQGVAPSAAAQAAPAAEAVADEGAADAESVDALFVGFSIGDDSIAP